MTTRRPSLAVVVLVVLVGALGSSCDVPTRSLPTPGRVESDRPVPLAVSVYGDSLAPTPDYVVQGAASGYAVTKHTAAGSHMCGSGDTPSSGAARSWVRILDDIAAGVDAIVLQYQGWQNYTLTCGGRMDAFPYAEHRATDPGKKWRVYLDEFRRAIEPHGDRTHLFVVLAIPSPADMPSWSIPQAIIDQGSRVMAHRHPGQITTVSARDLFADAQGGWVSHAPCIAQEIAAGYCAGGWVRLRHADRIHHACPGTGSLVCERPSPSGMRYRLRLFDAMNRHFAVR